MKRLVKEFWFKVFVSSLVVVLLILGGSAIGYYAFPQTPKPSEPEIPANYKTYTDETKVFSISYPPDWETVLPLLPDMEKTAKEVIANLKSGFPVKEATIIFSAAKRMATGNVFVNTGVESMPEEISTHDQMVEAAVRGIKIDYQDYQEFSRVKTTVDGRKATILDWQTTIQGRATRRSLTMITLVGKTAWGVSCTSSAKDFANWKKDFNTIVRSLRISE